MLTGMKLMIAEGQQSEIIVDASQDINMKIFANLVNEALHVTEPQIAIKLGKDINRSAFKMALKEIAGEAYEDTLMLFEQRETALTETIQQYNQLDSNPAVKTTSKANTNSSKNIQINGYEAQDRTARLE